MSLPQSQQPSGLAAFPSRKHLKPQPVENGTVYQVSGKNLITGDGVAKFLLLTALISGGIYFYHTASSPIPFDGTPLAKSVEEKIIPQAIQSPALTPADTHEVETPPKIPVGTKPDPFSDEEESILFPLPPKVADPFGSPQ